MRSTFHGLEVAKRSLFTQQAALHTTGHNIANANTAGYSRQVVNMQASRSLEAMGFMRTTIPGQLGMGVEFSSITRIREQFLDDQFRNEYKSLGSWSIQLDTLEKLETIMNEPSETGLRTVLDNFWKSWADLDPKSVTGKKIIRESALALTDAFNVISKQLSDLSADLTSSIQTKAEQINTLTSTIANLNAQIMKVEGLGDNANDLRDQRDLLVDELSGIVNINVTETAQGYQISMGTTELVNYNTAATVTAATLEGAFGLGDLSSGEVYGMIVSRDRFVADYQNQLDILANSIANGEVTITIPADTVLPEGTVLNGVTYTGANRTLTTDLTVKVNGVNGLHKLAYVLSDPIEVGGDFFTSKSGGSPITASDFQLNPYLRDNPEKIATSMRTIGTGVNEEVVPGNRTLPILMSQLKDSTFSFSGSGTLIGEGTPDDFFRSIVGQLGVQSKEASRQVFNMVAIVDQVDGRRQSVSGVSLDEEMSNLIKFQHAYAAAARVMTTFDELYEKVINGMGIVGR